MSASRLDLSSLLETVWKPALGCTEPASIAYGASLAASQVEGDVTGVFLRCDPRMFKNCFSVGIPNSAESPDSERHVGILWALALGCFLPNPSAELECFSEVTPEILEKASRLLERGAAQVEAIVAEDGLYVDCKVIKTGGVGRVVIEGSHTRVVAIEKNGVLVQHLKAGAGETNRKPSVVSSLRDLSFTDFVRTVQEISDADRARIREGCALNLAICRLGLEQFKAGVPEVSASDPLSRISQMVFAGVHARMSGASQVVMSVAGSGNKGITCSVPLVLFEKGGKTPQSRIEEAVALSIVLTSLTTEYLGTLSAICGCSNAAGIGLAGGLTYLQGGMAPEISFAVNNMVGNLSGIVCDGAKIGCALKAMSAVDAAFRAASFAMKGITIPASDGIVGADGRESIANLGRIANYGMSTMDNEILQIMRKKLAPAVS